MIKLNILKLEIRYIAIIIRNIEQFIIKNKKDNFFRNNYIENILF